MTEPEHRHHITNDHIRAKVIPDLRKDLRWLRGHLKRNPEHLTNHPHLTEAVEKLHLLLRQARNPG